MHRKSKVGRSLLERAEKIFDLIKGTTAPFPKSQLKEKGFSPDSAENWLKLIIYIQNQPKVELTQEEHYLGVSKASPLLDNVQNIFAYLKEKKQISFTELEHLGKTSQPVDDILKLIFFIQSQPKIKEIDMGRVKIYELENIR